MLQSIKIIICERLFEHPHGFTRGVYDLVKLFRRTVLISSVPMKSSELRG